MFCYQFPRGKNICDNKMFFLITVFLIVSQGRRSLMTNGAIYIDRLKFLHGWIFSYFFISLLSEEESCI